MEAHSNRAVVRVASFALCTDDWPALTAPLAGAAMEPEIHAGEAYRTTSHGSHADAHRHVHGRTPMKSRGAIKGCQRVLA